MLSARQGPALRTDVTFLQGRKTDGEQFAGDERSEIYGREAVRQARAAGVNPTGKVYLHSLANKPYDPQAWVSDRNDVARVCRERGWGCSGIVNVDRPDAGEVEDDTPYRVDPKIVNEMYGDFLEDNPEVLHYSAQERADIKESIEKSISPTAV